MISHHCAAAAGADADGLTIAIQDSRGTRAPHPDLVAAAAVDADVQSTAGDGAEENAPAVGDQQLVTNRGGAITHRHSANIGNHRAAGHAQTVDAHHVPGPATRAEIEFPAGNVAGKAPDGIRASATDQNGVATGG